MAALTSGWAWRTAGAVLRRDGLLDDADAVDGGEAEEAVDALDEFALGMGEEQRPAAVAGDGENARLVAAFAGVAAGGSEPPVHPEKALRTSACAAAGSMSPTITSRMPVGP